MIDHSSTLKIHIYLPGSREYIDLHFTWEPSSKHACKGSNSKGGSSVVGGGEGGGGEGVAGDSFLEEVATNGITYEDMLGLIDVVLERSGYFDVRTSR